MKLPRKGTKRHAYLTAEQMELLAEQAGGYDTLVYTLAHTGLRGGEATALRVSAFDTFRRRLLVQENAIQIGSALNIGTPKTHETAASASAKPRIRS